MSCYHPLIAVDKWRDENGERIIQILPQDAVSNDGLIGNYNRVFNVPCGHCLGCRTDQSLEWSNRLLMESLYHENMYFITLTYCDEYLRYYDGVGVNPENGEIEYYPTLYKPDFQKFMKRLREDSGEKLSYYLAGEYGEKGEPPRPHYHMILFGANDDYWKMIPCGRSETGNQYYRSEKLEDLWSVTEDSDMPKGQNRKALEKGLSSNLIGWCSIEKANYYTMRYVTAYVTKKLGNKPNDIYYMQNKEPPFSLSSKRPAIGLKYLQDHPDCLEDDKIVIGTPQGKVEFPVPRYFRKKCADVDPGLYDEISENRIKKSEDKLNGILHQTDLNLKEYLEIKEKNHYNKIKLRNKI